MMEAAKQNSNSVRQRRDKELTTYHCAKTEIPEGMQKGKPLKVRFFFRLFFFLRFFCLFVSI